MPLRAWYGRIPSLPLSGFFVFFGFLITRTGHTSGKILTIDTSYDVFPRKDTSFGDSVDTVGPIAKNFGSVNRHFPAKRAKYSNFYIIKTIEWISTKICLMIKTSNYSLWVVPKLAPRIKMAHCCHL